MTDKSGAPPQGADGKVASNVVPLPKREPWKAKLYRTDGKKPKIKNVIANGIVALREAPEWRGALRFDDNAQAIQLGRLPPDPWPQQSFVPRPWNEQDDGLLSEWLTRQGIDLSPAAASEATLIVARESPFHPIREYLHSLKWDGTPRISSWLFDYLGADKIGELKDYHAAIGHKWLISAVARAMNPGCQVDHVLIFEGLQGNGKSSFLRVLCGDLWFTDESPDINDKQDAALSLEGKWIVELAELDAFKGVSQERLKAFITRRKDRIRRPWGRRAIDIPRQCVFAGSTNQGNYLRDETGDRRYWPFKATKLDIEGIGAARDQLWAEAVVHYNAGVPHWLETSHLRKLAVLAQAKRFEADPWEEDVERFISDGILDGISDGTVSGTKAIFELLRPGEKITPSDSHRIAKILRHLGFEPDQDKTPEGKNRRFWRRLDV